MVGYGSYPSGGDEVHAPVFIQSASLFVSPKSESCGDLGRQENRSSCPFSSATGAVPTPTRPGKGRAEQASDGPGLGAARRAEVVALRVASGPLLARQGA